ncbi:MAG: hypothetical protein JJ892_14085 [Balneola sp.]|nr:hypothetical protein [Balneola sp.]MBO6649884.1 hypothetical protein [Balneola sp.]MBO6712448.1 hypothetical protein [Balneola sp.]MBO6801401.1 hypothetical protein [Balneola sp.]MBO6871785.1 hypothetical protein [Balneola sp.]
METQVEFKSSKFPPYADEEEIINPGRYGKRLAEYLVKELSNYGFNTEEIHAEDWGWAVPIENEEFYLWIGCGNVDDSEDDFLCFIEPSKPVIRKMLFKKIDTTKPVGKVKEALAKILESDHEITSVNWLPSGA